MLKSKVLSVFLVFSMMFSSAAVLANDGHAVLTLADEEIEIQVEADCNESSSVVSSVLLIGLIGCLLYAIHEAYDNYLDVHSGRVRFCKSTEHSAVGEQRPTKKLFDSPIRPLR